jgi:hypothetical protein
VALRDNGKRIAFAEIITGPNQDSEKVQEQLKRLLAEQGYAVGEMEYPNIVASALPPWDAPGAAGMSPNVTMNGAEGPRL